MGCIYGQGGSSQSLNSKVTGLRIDRDSWWMFTCWEISVGLLLIRQEIDLPVLKFCLSEDTWVEFPINIPQFHFRLKFFPISPLDQELLQEVSLTNHVI